MKRTLKLLFNTTALACSGLLLSFSEAATDEGTDSSSTESSPVDESSLVEEITFSKEDAQQAVQQQFQKQSAAMMKATMKEMEGKLITYEKYNMPYDYRIYGEEPEGGHSLYISLHGGGGAPPAVNDRQWKNQLSLYKPKEGIYVAPRAATNTWDLWHQKHIDPMLDDMIDRFVAHHGINVDKVYILGYSAGGDGIYQLAPRMADRWAGAAMMAGHPGDAKPHNLINLPYFIQCGGKDTPYDRNKRAREWGEMLDKLAEENPGRYPHKWIVYPNYGHWMNLECKQALPWMAGYKRDAWPNKLNWHQDDVLRKRFSWLANEDPKAGDLITAEIKGQTITLITENVKSITLRLNDELVNLDQEIVVKNEAGKELFKGKVERSEAVIERSLKERLDLSGVATAELKVNLQEEPTPES